MSINISNFELIADKTVLAKAERLISRGKVARVTQIDALGTFGNLYEGKFLRGRKEETLCFCVTQTGDILFDRCFCDSDELCEHYLAVLLRYKYGNVELDKRVFSPLFLQEFVEATPENITEFTDNIIARYSVKGIISDWYLPFCYDGLVKAAAKATESESFALRVEMQLIIISKIDKLISRYSAPPLSLLDFTEKINIMFYGMVKEQSVKERTRSKEAAYAFIGRTEKKTARWQTRLLLLRAMSVFCHCPGVCVRYKQLLTSYVTEMPDKSEELKALLYTALIYIDKKAAFEYLNENIDSPAFRRLSIFYALRDEEYSKVKKLCSDGIKKDAADVNLVKEWYKNLFTVYFRQEKIELQKKTARTLILLGDIDYYAEYKALFNGAEEWNEAFNGLLRALKRRKCDDTLYLQLLIEENKQDEILSFCDKNPDFIVGLYPYIDRDKYDKVDAIFSKIVLRKDFKEKNDVDRKAFLQAMKNVKIRQRANDGLKA